MKRTISPFALLLTSISAIIGSGWLFSSYFTAELAGPAALLSWIIGGIFIIIVAFVFAELCAMLPVSGSSVRIPQFTHGSIVSFIFAWMIWLSYLALMTTEVQAVVQYASFYFPTLAGQGGQLTHQGYFFATILMLLISAFNFYSIRWLIRANSFLTIIKIIIPAMIIITIFIFFFSVQDALHPVHSPFMPHGFHGVLAALSTGGILFAFNGFKQAAEMAGEVKNPQRAVPFAIVGSVIFCLILYVLLQLSFNSSLRITNLIDGWNHILLTNENSPFASILQQNDLPWLLPFLYMGAIIAPFAAGLMYCSSAGRSLAGMSQNGYLPLFLQKISPQGNPLYAITANFFLGMCLFAPLPGWDKMVSFLTSLLAITYAIGPICLLTLRYQVPHQARPLKLPFCSIWTTVALYICTLLAYFSGWDILSKLGIAVAIGFILLIISRFFESKKFKTSLNWRESFWMWPYLIGLSIISYAGDYGHGLNLFPTSVDLIIIALFSIVIMFLAVYFRLPGKITEQQITQLHLERQEETS